jgi:prepilin-type N-terminal cleavage/methylation domain-containing protein
MKRAFTLIELLIVVAIIAILAAIAVPNFLEAQTRAKVARVQSDLRAIATGVETYRVDHNAYPEGTDSPDGYEPAVKAVLEPYGLTHKYYGFRVKKGDLQVGKDFFGLTTPIAYLNTIPNDPFVKGCTNWGYCYRPAKVGRNGYVLTSIGPDGDYLGNGNTGKGNENAANPLSSYHDQRLGDISERAVIYCFEGGGSDALEAGKMRDYLQDLTYDASNGTISDGDVYRIGPGQ